MATSVATPPTYLSVCTQDVQPEKVTEFERKSTLWTVAAVVSTVAFFALAIGAFIAVGIFAEVYLPVAGISAIVVGLMAANKVKDFVDWGESAKNEADKFNEIQRHYTDLTAQNRQNPANPVLAHAKYFEAQTEQLLKKKDELKAKADATIEDVNEKGILLFQAVTSEDQALKAKLHNAFARAVAQNLAFAGTLETVGQFSAVSSIEMCMRENANSPRDVMFKFNRAHIAPITYQELKAQSVDQLVQRIRVGMIG